MNTVVPEPSALVQLIFTAVGCCLRRRQVHRRFHRHQRVRHGENCPLVGQRISSHHV
jgi:hypothetical protein